MLQEFSNHINTKFPFLKDKKIIIAISGGVDSVVLTHLLSKLNFNISLAHCNFKLRGFESDSDEGFVKKLGKELNINVFTTQFNTEKFAAENKQSIQIAARNLRYSWFRDLLKKYEFYSVLTAHHADDNLETFLINLTRGSGLEGFIGIPEKNNNIIRPLLIFSRDEILNYAKENNIDWREDKSNNSTKYVRNKIRHKIVPILKEINPSLLDSFIKTSNYLKESQQIIDDKVNETALKVITKENNFIKISISKINQLSNPKAYLYQLLKEYNFTEWQDVYNLLFSQSGKQIFSKTHTLLKDRTFLILNKKESLISSKNTFFIDKNTLQINAPIQLKFEAVKKEVIQNKQIIYVDKDTLTFPLKLRKWKNGDFFYPSGMKGRKKISKFFKDEKLSLFEKQNTWILCNNNNDIIWVIGYRQDKRFQLREKSMYKLKVSFL